MGVFRTVPSHVKHVHTGPVVCQGNISTMIFYYTLKTFFN